MYLIVFIDCGYPPAPLDGDVSLYTPNITTYQAKADQSCNDGYDVVGNGTIQCLADGNWSISVSCHIKGTCCNTCIILTMCSLCILIIDSFNHFDVLTELIPNSLGLRFVLHSPVKCMSNGNWSNPIVCQIKGI